MTRIDGLPKYLVKKAQTLDAVGVNGYAWSIDDSLKVVQWIAENRPKLIILGGDLYYSGDGIRPTYDNWYYQPNGDDDARNSILKALTYLSAAKKFPGSSQILVDLVASGS